MSPTLGYAVLDTKGEGRRAGSWCSPKEGDRESVLLAELGLCFAQWVCCTYEFQQITTYVLQVHVFSKFYMKSWVEGKVSNTPKELFPFSMSLHTQTIIGLVADKKLGIGSDEIIDIFQAIFLQQVY